MGNNHGRRRRSKEDLEEGGVGGGRIEEDEDAKLRNRRRRKSRGSTLGGAGGPLSEEQIRDVQLCWPHLEGRLEEILRDAFLALFNERDDVKERFFQAKSIVENQRRISNAGSDFTSSSATSVLHRHVPAVARAVAKAVRNADRLGDVAEYFKVMGKLHNQRGVRTFDLNLLGPHIVSSSLTHLPSHLRDRRHQESMLRLLSTVAEMMRAGYPEVALEVAPQEKWALQESLQALGDELACVGEEGVFPLGLGGVKIGGAGGLAQTMARDATLHEEAALATAMNNHGVWLFKIAEETVRDLDKRAKMEERLIELGRLHEKHGVRKQFLDAMGPAFCQTIRPVLQAQGMWDQEVREAWLRLFRVISFHMKRGYGNEQQQNGQNHKQHHHHHKHHHHKKHHHHHHHRNGNSKSHHKNIQSADEERDAMSEAEVGSPVRNGNMRMRQASREEDRIIVVAADMVCLDGGERRGSTGNLERAGGADRKVRVKAQHCHLFQPGRHPHLKNPRIAANNIQRKRITGSALSINNSMDEENSNINTSTRRSINPPTSNGKPASNTTIKPSRSEMDLTRRRRRSATATSATNSPSSSSFLLSPSGLGLAPSGFGTGVSSSLLKNANLAAAEAKAERKRRSSLHQLIGLAFDHMKKDEANEGVGRPRSKSETLEHNLKTK